MIRLIKCEILKIFKKISFRILLLIILISSFLTCYISYKKVDNKYNQYPIIEMADKRNLTDDYNKLATNINKINSKSNIKLNKIIDNGVTLLIFSSIIIIIISSSILGNEINKKSIKELLTKPYKRSKILISKYLVAYIITFLLSLLIFVSYVIFTSILTKINIFNLRDYMIFNKSIISVSYVIKYLIKYVINSIPIYFLSTFTIFLTTFIKNQKAIIPFNSVLFIMSPVIFNFFLSIKFKYIIYTFIPYLDLSIFKNIYSIYLLNIEYNINFNIFLGIIILLTYSLFFIIISIKIFDKKDFY